jgi:hypothetical protein
MSPRVVQQVWNWTNNARCFRCFETYIVTVCGQQIACSSCHNITRKWSVFKKMNCLQFIIWTTMHVIDDKWFLMPNVRSLDYCAASQIIQQLKTFCFWQSSACSKFVTSTTTTNLIFGSIWEIEIQRCQQTAFSIRHFEQSVGQLDSR